MVKKGCENATYNGADFALPARARMGQLLPYWSRRKGSSPSFSSRASGARKVT